MKNLILILIIGFPIYSMLAPQPDKANFTAVKQRHDFIKSIIGDLDDRVVAEGLISDKTLHNIGAVLGICDETPGALE